MPPPPRDHADLPDDARVGSSSARRLAADPPAPRFVEDYLLYLLARASHLVSAEFHARVRASGLSVAEWRVLASFAGSAGGETVGWLAATCLAQQPTTTKLLGRLERAGLVSRHADASDRRLVRLRLTGEGEARVAALLDAARAHEAEVAARLGGASRAAEVKAMLRALLAATPGTAEAAAGGASEEAPP